VRTRPLPLRTTASVRKQISAWGRGAVWLAADSIAVSGWTDSWDDGIHQHTAIGVRVVHPDVAAMRVLDVKAGGVHLVGSTVLASGGDALRGYTLQGRLRFEVLQVATRTVGRYAYVGSDNATRYAVVDTRAGRLLRTVKTRKQLVILGP
jgi:hypothetical protein